MMMTTISDAECSQQRMLSLWAAESYHDSICPPSYLYQSTLNAPKRGEIHIVPLLFKRRWIIFSIEPRRNTIELFDFLPASQGCEMAVFQVSVVCSASTYR
jgi:hypothetical protein